MGKSRTSGISKTGSGIGIGGGGGMVGAGGMGGSVAAQAQNQAVQNAQQNQLTTQTDAQDLIDASKIASTYGNNTAAMFANMTDDEMLKAVNDSIGVDMPNHLNDVKGNATQQFVFANGLNAKPTVLSDSDFDNYLKQNNISEGEIMLREVNPVTFTSNNVRYSYTPQDVTDMFKMSDINYIGGKQGGHAMGFGTYFAQGGYNGRNHITGYGSGSDGVGHKTMMGVLDKSKARAINYNSIDSKFRQFGTTHNKVYNKVNKMMGDTRAIKALLMGYNVITQASGNNLLKGGTDCYYNVIDRSAMVMRANNRR